METSREVPGGQVVKERLSRFLQSCCRVLEDTVADDDAFMPVTAVYRDGGNHPVAIMIPTADGLGDAMTIVETALPLAATGFDSDLVVLVSDTYHAQDLINPLTGKNWEHGEMGAVFEMGNPGGLVGEALSMCASTPTGILAVGSLPYVRKGKDVEWAKPEDSPTADANGVEGRIPQMLMSIWNGKHLVATPTADRQILDLLLIDLLAKVGMEVSTNPEGT